MAESVDTEQLKDLRFERRMALRYVHVAFSSFIEPFTPQHQYTFSPHCSLYISHGTDKENLFNNQEPL